MLNMNLVADENCSTTSPQKVEVLILVLLFPVNLVSCNKKTVFFMLSIPYTYIFLYNFSILNF